MPVIDLGKVVGDPGASMRFRGEWNGGSEYFNNESYIDTVTHHGSLWVCKQTNTGQEPIEGDYWGIGAQGNSDLNASDVTYDNESSGLSSNTAQGAIDEIVEIEKVVNGNQADLYSPDETYTAGRLVINNNALWKAKQDINVAEPWTPEHWDSTTIAKELEENIDASKVTYNNESSGLTAQTVQEAIDENAEAISALNSSPEVINITPISGSNYSEYGNCYYYKKGSRVHIHIGIQGLTGGVNTTISILPSGYQPSSLISAIGFGAAWSEKAVLLITQNGELNVQSEGSYAMIDVEYDAFS